MVVFPSVRLGGKHVRFVYLRFPGSFYVTDRASQEDIPLFLGADILSGSSILTKNHGRIHGRFSKDKCATKVTIKGVTVEGIKHSSQLWFYTIQGLFRATFEYLNTTAQSDCLQYLTDLWLQTKSHNELPQEMSLTYFEDDLLLLSGQLLDTSKVEPDSLVVPELLRGMVPAGGSPQLGGSLRIMPQKAGIAATARLGEPPDNVLLPGEHMVELAVGDISSCLARAGHGTDSGDALEFSILEHPGDTSGYGSVMFLDRVIAPSVPDIEVDLAENASSTHEAESNLNLDQIWNYLVTFVKNHEQKIPDIELALVKKLKMLLHFFKVEYLDGDPSAAGFPVSLLERYATLSAAGVTKPASFHDAFDTAPKVNVALCLVCEWLGKELHGFSEVISEKGETFKLQHIDSINNLPSPQSLVDRLFPACMKILMMNWMGQQDMDYVDTAVRELSSDHSYSPPCKRAKSVPAKQLGNAFPFIQLILEFANNVLISGVAHVLYSRLLHDGSC